LKHSGLPCSKRTSVFFSLNFKPAQAGICFVKVRDPLKQSAKIEP
jgi:hypothetical protein